MNKQIKNNVSWVGRVDFEVYPFHYQEPEANCGTSYNSYIIKEEKTALIDTVARPFAEEFMQNLKAIVDLGKIDYVVVNHAEPDHSGALPELMRLIPGATIVCTKNCVESLKGHYHQDWNFQAVKTGDRLSLGEKELVFVEAPLLHWPDTMFSYLTQDNILFSNDVFGQHFASEEIFDEAVDQAELQRAAMKYYANILSKFSPLVLKKITELKSMGLPIELICPSHGVTWQKHCAEIMATYLSWADNFEEERAVIVYDSMWGATALMAEQLAKGIQEIRPEMKITTFKAPASDQAEIVTEIFRSKLALFGSPTLNNAMMGTMASLLESVRGLGFKNKAAVAFGSYGWSGESVARLSDGLQQSGFKLLDSGLKIKWQPDESMAVQIREFGEKVAKLL